MVPGKVVAVVVVGLMVLADARAARAEDATTKPSPPLAMGLAERRAVSEYQEKTLPGLVQRINTAVGFEPTLEVRWNEIALPGDSERYNTPEYWTNIYFIPLIDALTNVARDDEGKKALKGKLKSIVIRFDPDSAPASNYVNGVRFENGVLEINYRPWSNADDIEPRAKAIVGVMEPKL
jgi:hypothetical protein